VNLIRFSKESSLATAGGFGTSRVIVFLRLNIQDAIKIIVDILLLI